MILVSAMMGAQFSGEYWKNIGEAPSGSGSVILKQQPLKWPTGLAGESAPCPLSESGNGLGLTGARFLAIVPLSSGSRLQAGISAEVRAGLSVIDPGRGGLQ